MKLRCIAVLVMTLTDAHALDATDLLNLINTPDVEYGAVQTPAGLFVTRGTAPWGESGPANIVRIDQLPDGSPASSSPSFASADASDSSPFYDQVKQRLCFVSNRSGPKREVDRTDGDIWCATLNDSLWQPPVRLPEPINSTGAEYSPVFDDAGMIYFASDRPGGFGQGDIYRGWQDESGPWQVENLGDSINSSWGEWNLGLVPGAGGMIFESSSRPDNLTIPGDLYFSQLEASRWTPAIALSRLNSRGSDLLPRWIDADTLVYATSSNGDVDHVVATSSQWRPLEPALVSVSRSSGELVILDPLTLSERARIALEPGIHELASSDDGRLAIVPLFGIFPKHHDAPVQARPKFIEVPSNGIARVDLAAGSVVTLPVERCSRPHAVAVDSQASRAWITCEQEGYVLEVDPVDGAQLRRFHTGVGVHKVVFNVATQTLVAVNPDQGQISRIAVKTGEVSSLKTGLGSEGISLSADGSYAWVSNSGDGSYCQVDLKSMTLEYCSEARGGFAISTALVAERNEIWVARLGTNTLSIHSVGNGHLLAEIKLPSGALNLATNTLNGLVYASLPRRNEVVAISLDTRRIVAVASNIIEGDDLDLIPSAYFATAPDRVSVEGH